MREQTRSQHEALASAGGPGTIFDEPDDTGRLVTVSSTLHHEQLPVSGSTVGQIRARFRQRFDIDPRSVAVLDGHRVDDDIIVQPGQVLLFMREGGGKGLSGACAVRAVPGRGRSVRAPLSLHTGLGHCFPPSEGINLCQQFTSKAHRHM